MLGNGGGGGNGHGVSIRSTSRVVVEKRKEKLLFPVFDAKSGTWIEPTSKRAKRKKENGENGGAAAAKKTKNRDVSTGALARLFVRSFEPSTFSLASSCSLH